MLWPAQPSSPPEVDLFPQKAVGRRRITPAILWVAARPNRQLSRCCLTSLRMMSYAVMAHNVAQGQRACERSPGLFRATRCALKGVRETPARVYWFLEANCFESGNASICNEGMVSRCPLPSPVHVPHSGHNLLFRPTR